MTLGDFLGASYGWADAHANELLLAAVVVPLLGTLAARVGKAGRTDADGKFIASVVLGIALVAALIEAIAIGVGHGAFGRSVLDANLKLLVAPVLCLVGSLVGIRLVFPLSEVATFRTFTDLAIFLLLVGAVVWLFSMFRGWGIVFFGHVTELAVIGVLGIALIRRYFLRAFGSRRRPELAGE